MSTPPDALCPCVRCQTARKQGRNAERAALSETWKINLRLIGLRHEREALQTVREIILQRRETERLSLIDVLEIIDERIAARTITLPPRGSSLDAVQAVLDALDLD